MTDETDENPSPNPITQLRRDMERFRASVEEQKQLDAEHRKQLEDELHQTQRKLAEAQHELAHRARRSDPHTSYSSPFPVRTQRPLIDDPFLPAPERHRLHHNPQPHLKEPPTVPTPAPPTPLWSRWNPLQYIRTPFLERDGSFEFRRPRLPSPAPPGAFSPETPPRSHRHGILRGGDNIDNAPSGGTGAGLHDHLGDLEQDDDVPDAPHDQQAPHTQHTRPTNPAHYDYDSPHYSDFRRSRTRDGYDHAPKLKPEDISTFDGEDSEFFIASCLSFAAIYGERRVLEVVHRALSYARQRYFWPLISRDIKSYCRKCHLCQTCKTDTSKKPGCLQPIPTPSLPFATICIDFVEGLPVCSGGLNSLASITDKFSKAIRLIPCKKSDSGPAFAQRFFQFVYPVWGVPEPIISDRDCRFVSAFWHTLMRLAGTKVALTTAYHPQADGQAERTNRTIESTMRILCIETSHSWLSLLPHIELAHNFAPCSSTGFTPFSLLYAYSPRLFGDHALPHPLHSDVSVEAEDLASELNDRRAIASSAITRAQSLQKRQFDTRHSPRIFAPGDWATFIYSGTLRHPHKLAPTGTVVQILEAISPVAYRIRVPSSSRMHDVVSIEHLRRYNRRSSDTSPAIAPPTPPPPSISPSIHNERIHNGNREVQILVDKELIWRLDDRAPSPRRSARLSRRS